MTNGFSLNEFIYVHGQKLVKSFSAQSLNEFERVPLLQLLSFLGVRFCHNCQTDTYHTFFFTYHP